MVLLTHSGSGMRRVLKGVDDWQGPGGDVASERTCQL